MDKVIRDGKVAVLYSPGYGAGWYTWNPSHPEIVFHPTLVQLVEENNHHLINEDLIRKLLSLDSSEYICDLGIKDLEICWLPLNTEFMIDDYDGSEDIFLKEEIKFLNTGEDMGNITNLQSSIRMDNIIEELPIIEESPYTQEKPVKEPTTSKLNSQYFKDLNEFLNQYGFVQTPIPWRKENKSYIINQVVDADSFGFPIYSITCKRYFDDSSFRGRLPNSKFAEEVFMSIAEDYHLANLEMDLIDRTKQDDEYVTLIAEMTTLREKDRIHIEINSILIGTEVRYRYTIMKYPVEYNIIYQSPTQNTEAFKTYLEALRSAVHYVHTTKI